MHIQKGHLHSLTFRKRGWTEQRKVLSECVLKCNFFMQAYCMSKFQIIFLPMQHEYSK